MTYAGIDVSKAGLDVAVHDGGAWHVDNTDRGITTLVTTLTDAQVGLVVLEATGAYHHSVTAALIAAGLAVAVVNPRQVRDFGRSTGQLAKTDRLDAALLARFAAMVRPEPRVLPDEATQELAALVTRRRQLIEMRVAEQNRLTSARSRVIKKSLKRLVEILTRELAMLDRDLDAAVRQSPQWQADEDLLRSHPGVGPVVARTCLALLPELGRCTSREIAALVGVAPHARDSGTYRGTRHCWGGRAAVRAALYMGALSAIRCNRRLKTAYERLRERGKPAKVALVAIMRRLLVTLNAMLKNNQRWREPTPATA